MQKRKTNRKPSYFRFKYDTEADVEEMVATGSLKMPRILPAGETRNAKALNEFVEAKVRVGDCILLGHYDPDERTGEVIAIGRVDSMQPERCVSWKRTERQLRPTPSGERYWKSHAIFKFAKDPVTAYDLPGWFSREFPEVVS